MCSDIGNCGCDTLKYIKMHHCYLCCLSCESEYQRRPLSICELLIINQLREFEGNKLNS